MSARILVVDDVPANVKILEAKLKASYFTVLSASNGYEALEAAASGAPDLILLDIMMPEMDGFECCRRLKADPALAHIPVVMVTALDHAEARVRGLEAGADDFLTKPPNDLALFARVRSLVRVKMMIDELRARDDTFRDMDAHNGPAGGLPELEATGRVMIVDSLASRAKMIERVLTEQLPVEVSTASTREQALDAAAKSDIDLFIVSNRIENYDGLRLCSELRAHPNARHSALVVVVEDGAFETIASALDLGANDYLMRPIDENELAARAKTQLLRKNYADCLRADLNSSVKMAVTDGLTGLYNRRYAEQHLTRQLQSVATPTSVALLDLDHFKLINDTYGHPVGDDVLRQVADRMREGVRSVDLVSRYGGEEFLVVMPGTDEDEAMRVAERLRQIICSAPIARLDGAEAIPRVTASLGVATYSGPEGCVAEIIERADRALYRAKHDGRNQVVQASDQAAEIVEVA